METRIGQESKTMKFLCFGMGAIGTYIGGSLLLAGHQVAFVERGEPGQKPAQKALNLDLSSGRHSLMAEQVFFSLPDAMAAASYDAALVAVKSFDSGSLAQTLRPLAAQFPPLICLQNGVENEEVYAEVLGQEKVIGASIATAVSKDGLGSIAVEKMRGIGIESVHPLSDSIIEAFRQAGLNPRGYPRRGDLKWSKMITNLLGNATSAILNWTPTQVFADRQVYHLEVLQIKETLQVMEALGLRVVNLPGTPIKPLVELIHTCPEFLSRPVSWLGLGKGRGAKMPSFHIDFYAGQKRSEVTFLNGAVVRWGQKLGIPTSVNQVLCEVLEKLASGEYDKKDWNDAPEMLLKRIAR
jgi:2-dehydropantoate 2-reductase